MDDGRRVPGAGSGVDEECDGCGTGAWYLAAVFSTAGLLAALIRILLGHRRLGDRRWTIMKRKLVILGLGALLAGLAACGWALFVRINPPELAVQADFTSLPGGTNLYTGWVSFYRGGGGVKVRPEVEFQSRLGVVFLECPPFSNPAPAGAKTSRQQMQFHFAVPSSVHRFRLGAEYEAPGEGWPAALGRLVNLLPARLVPAPVNSWLGRNGAWNVSRREVFQDLWTTNTAGRGGDLPGFRGHGWK